MDNLTTIATFDDLRRCEAVLTDGTSDIGKVLFVSNGSSAPNKTRAFQNFYASLKCKNKIEYNG